MQCSAVEWSAVQCSGIHTQAICVVCSWFLVLGSWFLILGSWFLVLGSWFLVLATEPSQAKPMDIIMMAMMAVLAIT